MKTCDELKLGDKVIYGNRKGRGIVKSVHPFTEAVWVVFNCGEDWENYQNYTAQLTFCSDLTKGWSDENVTNQNSNKMRTLFAFLFFVAFTLASCDKPQPPAPTQPAPPEQPPAVAQTESGEPLGASNAIIVPTVYVSYSLTRGAGAIQVTGGEFVQTKAWMAPTAQDPNDPTRLMRDLIVALEREGVLAGVDLTKTKSNWLIVLFPGASPRRDFVLDSRDLPQPKQE